MASFVSMHPCQPTSYSNPIMRHRSVRTRLLPCLRTDHLSTPAWPDLFTGLGHLWRRTPFQDDARSAEYSSRCFARRTNCCVGGRIVRRPSSWSVGPVCKYRPKVAPGKHAGVEMAECLATRIRRKGCVLSMMGRQHRC